MSDLAGKISIVPGFKDILPHDQECFTYIKKVIRHRCRQSGLRRISTPILENYSLFEKAYPNYVDGKLYFCEQDDQKLALKPDGTMGVMRAYLGSNMQEWPQPVELYYFEPYFLKKDDSASLNYSYQFGVEVIGEEDPALITQMIHLMYKIMQDLGIVQLFKLKISTLGCVECQKKYLTDLDNFYVGKERSLCQNCLNNRPDNLLALKSCDEEDCKILSELAPPIQNYWCKDCQQKLNDLKSYLQALKIPFEEDYKIGKPKNYLTELVFKFQINSQKSKDIICFGGQYQNLFSLFGSEQNIPALGCSTDIDILMKYMKKEKIKVPSKDNLHVFVAQLGRDAKEKSLILTESLQEAGIKTVGTLGKGSMREQLTIAEKFKVPYMIIMGLTEVREGKAILRDMKVGSQRTVSFDNIIDEVKNLIGEKELDTYSPGELLY